MFCRHMFPLVRPTKVFCTRACEYLRFRCGPRFTELDVRTQYDESRKLLVNLRYMHLFDCVFESLQCATHVAHA